jgi:hypothetical protein
MSSLPAGFGATTVHIALMTIKHCAGILPGFEPYKDPQRLLSSMTALTLDAPLSWLPPFINGALILDFVFGRFFAHLPCRSALAKGGVFGFAAWLVMGLGLLPLAGRGIFALKLGLGVLPAPPMLAMLMIYAMVMSRLYAWLPVPPDTKADGRS